MEAKRKNHNIKIASPNKSMVQNKKDNSKINIKKRKRTERDIINRLSMEKPNKNNKIIRKKI